MCVVNKHITANWEKNARGEKQYLQYVLLVGEQVGLDIITVGEMTYSYLFISENNKCDN